MANIFNLTERVPRGEERVDDLVRTSDILIRRIVSNSHSTTAGTWYDQDRDEWVLLLRGKAILSYDDGATVDLKSGDYVFIPAHRRHRVERTSDPCFWVAVHAVLT
jgi:cupin 2 domain-containing protein